MAVNEWEIGTAAGRAAVPEGDDPILAPLLYNAALFAASPLLLGYLLYRLVWRGKSRAGLAQRFGAAPRLGPPPAAGRVWLHAVSAGEMVAAAPIARELVSLSPGTEIILSSTTPAGFAQARRLVPEAAAHFFFPFDFLPCVRWALARTRPTVVASVETEIWPNWLREARRRGARVALLNGKISDRNFRRASRVRPLYRWALGLFDAMMMQTAVDRERATSLGALERRLRVGGNTKFEQEVTRLDPRREAQVRAELGLTAGEPLWIAGSTHAGEEAQVLDAYVRTRTHIPNLRLLIAPRHIERADEVAATIEQSGFLTLRRTQAAAASPSAPPTPNTQHSKPPPVVLLDTIGELAAFYALADVVFVGGSLVTIGGHDVLQPLLHGKPTLFGPHMHNQRDLAAQTLAAGAAVQVADADALADEVARCLTDPDHVAALTRAGANLLTQHRGAARSAAELLVTLLEAARSAPTVR